MDPAAVTSNPRRLLCLQQIVLLVVLTWDCAAILAVWTVTAHEAALSVADSIVSTQE